MYIPPKAAWFTLHSDSKELFESLRDRMGDCVTDSIGSKEFVCVNVNWTSSDGVTARFTEFTRVTIPWRGEGLPPVGIECEHAVGGGWRKVFIVAHDLVGSEQRAIHRFCGDDQTSYFGDSAGSFRPIRTPEQIAADERENTIDQMINDTSILTGIMSDRRIMAGQLYDAGYRKTDVQ